MKTIVSLLIVLLISCNVIAQDDFSIEPPSKDTTKDQKRVKNEDSPSPWNGLYIGPVASAIRSVIFNSGSGSLTNGFSFDAGGEISYMVFPNIGFSTGLRFQQYSFSYSYTSINSTTSYNGTNAGYSSGGGHDTIVTAGYNSTANYTFDYLRIPLLARYISSGENKVGFYCEMGFVADILVSAKVSGSATQTQYSLSQPPNTAWYNYDYTLTPANANMSETNLDATKFNVSFRAGLGVEIPLSSFFLVLDYGIDYRLLNGGTGKNDVVSFGTNQYYFYGAGNYGCFNFQSLEAKLIFKLNK